MNQLFFNILSHYKKPSYLPSGWLRIDHIRKNSNGEYAYWLHDANVGYPKKKFCSLEQLTKSEKDGFVKIIESCKIRTFYDLWMNSKGEMYILPSVGDPYIIAVQNKIKPIFVLDLPPAPEENYQIPERYFQDNAEINLDYLG